MELTFQKLMMFAGVAAAVGLLIAGLMLRQRATAYYLSYVER